MRRAVSVQGDSRAAVALLACLSLLAAAGPPASPALAQGKGAARPMLVRWAGQGPLLSFQARDFVNREIEKKLKSGLPQRIVTRVYAYAEGREQPLMVSALSCRVVYDLWEGGFRVERQTERDDRALSLRHTAAVVDACLAVDELALGGGAVYQKHRGKRVYFAAIVELNPLSPDTVQRIRRWLSKGGGPLAGDAFFGSFVSIFVRRQLGSAEHSLTFRSKTYQVP